MCSTFAKFVLIFAMFAVMVQAFDDPVIVRYDHIAAASHTNYEKSVVLKPNQTLSVILEQYLENFGWNLLRYGSSALSNHVVELGNYGIDAAKNFVFNFTTIATEQAKAQLNFDYKYDTSIYVWNSASLDICVLCD